MPITRFSLAPRESYRELGGSPHDGNVWSVICFFIIGKFRKKGLTTLQLREAIEYAVKEAAVSIEAYPVVKDSPSYRSIGLTTNFEKADFNLKKNRWQQKFDVKRIPKL